MTERIKKVEAWQTPDGELHKTELWARYHLAVEAVIALLKDNESTDPNNILNKLASHYTDRDTLRTYLDIADELENQVMGMSRK